MVADRIGGVSTHDVANQPPPLDDPDPLGSDRARLEGLRREGGGWAEESVAALGRATATPEARLWAAQANDNPPRLKTHDRFGHRIDEVEFHPAWHELMKLSVAHGLHSS